jgi:hypothetical protein
MFTVISSGYGSISINTNSTNVSEVAGFSTSVALLLVDMKLQPENNKIKITIKQKMALTVMSYT